MKSPALVSDYDFDLPTELIAQAPLDDRAGARMLTLSVASGAASGAVQDRHFADLPEMLRAGDLLVLNDSRVLPARLFARRTGIAMQAGQPAARIEVLLTEEAAPREWKALVRPGKKVQRGTTLEFPADGVAMLKAEVTDHGEFGERTLRFEPVNQVDTDFYAALDELGQMPLPPYIRRPQSVTTDADKQRYQTVYARERGSVAAPTAGLHFTPAMLAVIAARGIEIAHITLHVGLGTFQPVRVDQVAQIRLHRERYTLSNPTADALNRARAEGRRVVAVGTTTVRTLEHCARQAAGAPLEAHSGSTDIFLSPGDEFQLVSAMLTNFHLPASTLLMLVSAFGGYESVMAAYRHAVAQRYRFFSYGDCMFLS